MNRSVFCQFIPQRQNHPLLWCVLLALLVLAGFVVYRGKSAQAAPGQLNFQQRVAHQRAIEEVYWRHRIWPKENPQPKPPLAAVMPDAALRAKVEDTLRQSAALDALWQRPLTGAQLQAEMERMASHSKQPALLRELWAALGNDPFVIAECLARPALAERLLRNWAENDERLAGQSFDDWWQAEASAVASEVRPTEFAYRLPKLAAPAMTCTDNTWTPTKAGVPKGRSEHTAIWTGSEMIIFGGGGTLGSAGRYNPATDTWAPMNDSEVRAKHTAVWTGTEMIVWGGRISGVGELNTGGRYNPATNTWVLTNTTNAPSVRFIHTAVWTGNEMIIWGGSGNNVRLDTGGRYNPNTDSWTPTNTTNAPSGKSQHTAVWTGSLMIVWGGAGGLQTGGRYNPASDSWAETSMTNVPAGRIDHTAVWTGTEMIVWGGINTVFLNTGGRYNPTTDAWTATTLTNVPDARSVHTAVWTGSEMIVWGGGNNILPFYLNTGSRYNPALDKWTALTTTNAPTARQIHTAVWTGTEMIVWGGAGTNVSGFNTGGRYNPSLGTWTPTNAVVEIEERTLHTSVWTGTEMIVWGGNTPSGGGTQTGGRYNPATDTWTPTSLTNVPEKRINHTAVWTGSEMIIYGGFSCCIGCGLVGTGGRYNPATNSWLATSPASAAAQHTAVWTGSEMIVWGGRGCGSGAFGGGQRYNPTSNSWQTISSANAPTGRYLHTAIWTGTEMIVWGGDDGSNGTIQFNTGGRYNLASNSWMPTTTANAPSARENHTAVWTGSEMIVWGSYFFGTPTIQNTGGRYNPAINSWTATTTVDAPAARFEHTAVWTGDEMIIWGGIGGPSINTRLNTGGRYNPIANAWRATNFASAPTGRSDHTAIWTGSEMIVFGGDLSGSSDSINTGARYCALPPPLAISPTSKTVAGGGGGGTINVFASASINWTAVSNAAWITITSGSSGSGNGSISYTVAANPTTQPRTSTITIDTQTFTVNQEANCTTPINLNQTLNGALTATDCPASQRGSTFYADQYIFTAAAGQQVAVLLTSSAFDTYLYLIGPNGAVIAENDDGGGGTNSRIPGGVGFFALPASGQYIAEVTSANPMTTGAYTISLTAPSCAYQITPANQSFAAAGGNGTVNVTTAGGCNWSAVSNDAWLTITSGASGSGSGAVSFTVAANTGAARSGTLTIAGQTFTVNQAAPCSYSILPTSQNFAAAGGSNVVGVTASAGCAWTATSNAAWLTLTSGSSGSGNGTVNYTVAANAGPQRSGTLTVAGQTFTVNQDSGCSFTINPTNQNFAASGGSGNVAVTASNAACSWIATSNAAWLTITAGASGSGNGTVSFTVAASTSPQRSGTLTIAGQTFTVTQDNGCVFTLNPASQNVVAAGGNGSVNVSAGSGCNWTAVSNAAWITVTNGATGSGNGTVGYSVALNTDAQRSGTLTIAGQTFTVTQNSGCVFSIVPTGLNAAASGATGIVDVSAGSGCAWTAVSNAVWITITGGSSGSGSGMVNYSVAANTGPQRNGTLTIAGQTFTVTQDGGCSFSINPLTQNFTAAGGNNSVAVTAGAGCNWNATSNAVWLTITSGGSGSGNGAVNYTVAANAGPSRNGTLTIAGQTFTVTQNSGCPIITVTPASLPLAFLGLAFNQQLTQTGGTGAPTWSVPTGSLPNGVSLNPATGLLSGTPTASGTFNFTARMTDANGCSGESAYTLTVSACPVITISPNTLPGGLVGAAYSQTLTANGGTPGYTFTLDGGTLPTGLSLAASGLLSGAPTAAGAFSFTVKVTDQAGCLATKSYAITVCATININPATLPAGFVGSAYSQQLTQAGGVGISTWGVSAGALPAGITLNATGLLSGTSAASGVANFTLRATDVNGCFGERQYTVIVSGNGLQFYPLPQPVRLLETRVGFGGCTTPGAPINANGTLTLPARTPCAGITVNAAAVTGNITVVPVGPGFLTLFPSSAAQPTVANSNFAANEITNNRIHGGPGCGRWRVQDLCQRDDKRDRGCDRLLRAAGHRWLVLPCAGDAGALARNAAQFDGLHHTRHGTDRHGQSECRSEFGFVVAGACAGGRAVQFDSHIGAGLGRECHECAAERRRLLDDLSERRHAAHRGEFELCGHGRDQRAVCGEAGRGWQVQDLHLRHDRLGGGHPRLLQRRGH